MKKILFALSVTGAALFLIGCGEEDPLEGTPPAPTAAGGNAGPANAEKKGGGGMPPPQTAPGADG